MVNCGIFESVRFFCLVAASRPAENSAYDITDAAAVIASLVVAVVVVTTILPETCVISPYEAIAKLLRRGILVVV